MRRFFNVNGNLFLRSSCIMAVSLGVTSAGARLGAMTLAVNVVMMQFFTLFSYFMDGFAFSGEALIGRWYGASDERMLRRSVRALLKWTSGVALLFTLAYAVGVNPVASLITDSDAVLSGVSSMRWWLVVLPAVSAWAFIYDGFFVGITDTALMARATLVASVVFYIVAFLNISDGGLHIGVAGNGWLWTAFLLYLFMRGVVLAIAWRRKGL